MITLAIETSGRAGSIALRIDGQPHVEIDLTANGRRHARTLVPEIGRLLVEHQLTPAQLELVAVSIGPGSFTGLRVGLVCAKTLAYAVGCPLVGVDTFLAVANAQAHVDQVWVIEDALRGDICAAKYCRVEGHWRAETSPVLVSFDSWNRQRQRDLLVTGPGLMQWASELGDAPLGEAASRQPQAAHVAAVGEQLAAAGDLADAWTLEPFYMRRSAAEEKADAAGATS